jgi:4-hydroxy-tetrahydrodipicolinate reductase
VIRVGVFGAGGRMGSTVCRAVLDDPGLELVAAVDPERAGIDLDQLGVRGADLQVAAKPDAMQKADVDVAVDFTVLEAARENLAWCAEHRIHAVVGTTGFSAHDLDAFREAFAPGRANAVIAPNFAIGAVLMMHFAALAAPYFETAEVIELHHDAKADAPSGTAMLTVERMAAASGDWAPDPTSTVVVEGARGGAGPAGIRVHSVRMRGVVAIH